MKLFVCTCTKENKDTCKLDFDLIKRKVKVNKYEGPTQPEFRNY